MGADLPEGALSRFPRTSSTTGRREYDKGDKSVNGGSFVDSVLPIVEAGLADFMDGTKEVAGCLTPEPVPGHAPGMLSFRLRSRGEEGLFTADIMHNAIQIVRPDWNDRYCLWPDKALESRAAVLRARGRARRADHADASRRALLRLCAPAGRRLRLRAGHMSEHRPQQREGAPRARRGRVVDDGAPARAAIEIARLRQDRRLRTRSMSISSIRSLSLRNHQPDLRRGAGRLGIAAIRARAAARADRGACSTAARSAIIVPDVRSGRAGARGRQGREISAARRARLCERAAALSVRSLPATRPSGADAAPRIDRAVRSVEASRPADGDLRGRGRRHGAVRHQRSDRRHGHSGRLREPEGARRLRARDRGREEARQACRRRRLGSHGRSSPPNSSRWARATSRPARISASCSRPRPSRPSRCARWRRSWPSCRGATRSDASRTMATHSESMRAVASRQSLRMRRRVLRMRRGARAASD